MPFFKKKNKDGNKYKAKKSSKETSSFAGFASFNDYAICNSIFLG